MRSGIYLHVWALNVNTPVNVNMHAFGPYLSENSFGQCVRDIIVYGDHARAAPIRPSN